ncbi:hypothetical protein CL619_04060 [archaeon]|nr:hypothetical protein [archaeon]
MNIAIYLEPETKQDFDYIVKSYDEYGTLYTNKDTISMRFPLTDASRFIVLLQRLQEWCSPNNTKKRCKAVCRNGSDCLNSAQFKDVCWKHSNWAEK